MAAPQQGGIIIAQVFDPQGRNPKSRPLVIVTPTDEIKPDEPIVCAVITGTFPRKIPTDCVLLPYHPKGHPRTGLTKRCAAMTSWLVEIKEAEIRDYVGRCPRPQLDEIIERIESLE